MKKILISATIVIASFSLFLVSCKFKNNDNITPTYRNQSTGTGANPNINVATVTGVQTIDNPATQNSSLYIGNSGWNYDSYSSHPTYFRAQNGSTIIEVQFKGNITTGTFALTAGAPGAGQARIVVYNAPGQPDGIVWYSRSGSVVVTTSGPTFSAAFSNIPCLQQNFLFPTVTVSGNVTC